MTVGADFVDVRELAGSLPSLPRYHCVVLADVAELPAEVSAALGRFVRNGGGLIVAAGAAAAPAFYNGWSAGGGSTENVYSMAEPKCPLVRASYRAS